MVTVGEIEHPEPRKILCSDPIPTGAAVKATASERRLAVRIGVAIHLIVFEHVHHFDTDAKRFGESGWLNEGQIISGGVVLRKLAPDASHQAADGKIESRRTELTLVA